MSLTVVDRGARFVSGAEYCLIVAGSEMTSKLRFIFVPVILLLGRHAYEPGENETGLQTRSQSAHSK
jgi:hypothetical protein